MADLLVGRQHRGAFNNPLGINTPQCFTKSAAGSDHRTCRSLRCTHSRVLPNFWRSGSHSGKPARSGFRGAAICNVGSDPFWSDGSRVVGSLDCHNCDCRDSIGLGPFRHQHSIHKRCFAGCVLCRACSDRCYVGLSNCRKGASAARARAEYSRAGSSGGTTRGRASSTGQRGAAAIGTTGGSHWNF